MLMIYLLYMSRGHSKNGGFTIIETMITLAISGVLLVVVMATMSSQQGKTEFSQLVRIFESSLQDTANDVSTGFSSFPIGNNGCWYDVGGVHIGVAPSPFPASDTHCIFAGKAIQFAPSGPGLDATNYVIYPVVGMQKTSSGQEVTRLKDASLQTLSTYQQTQQLGSGATFNQIIYSDNSGVNKSTSVIGFYTTLQGYTASGLLNSGATNTDVIATTANIGDSISTGAAAASSVGTAPTWSINPSSGITICIKSGSSNQHALITVGGSGGRLTVNSTIYGGGSCS